MRPVGWKHPRSGYYAWRDRPLSATARRRQDLTIIIARFFADSDQTYGYRRIRAELARHGIQASAQTVRKIMAANDMTPCQPRKKTRTTVQAADLPGRPDRLHRNFTANAPAVTWVGDITYIPTWQGFVYLATVMDCFSKKIIGYAMAGHMRTELISQALAMATRVCPPVRGATASPFRQRTPGRPGPGTRKSWPTTRSFHQWDGPASATTTRRPSPSTAP